MSLPYLPKPLLHRLIALAPAGFRMVRRVRFTDRHKDFIDYMRPEWGEQYDKKGYALRDPVFLWSIFNVGSIRWSEIAMEDHRNVLQEAKKFGLVYGAVVSRNEDGRYSLLSVSRSDREFTDDEVRECEMILDAALHGGDDAPILKPAELAVLRQLAEGLTLEASATASGVAISTIKNRLNYARKALGAKTSVQAVSEAIKRDLF